MCVCVSVCQRYRERERERDGCLCFEGDRKRQKVCAVRADTVSVSETGRVCVVG